MTIRTIWKANVEDGIGIIAFNVTTDSMNTWTEGSIDEFLEPIDALEKGKGIKGMIIISGKPDNFHSGANLRFLEQFHSKEELRRALDRFSRAFSGLGDLPFPSVAAIHGHCLGGGYELALVCTARIAKESKTTMS